MAVLGLMWLVGLAACGDKENPGVNCPLDLSGQRLSYAGTGPDDASSIRYLMRTYCVSCHNSVTASPQGAPSYLRLDSYGGVRNNAFDVDLSMANAHMPPRGTVPTDQVCRFDSWIRQGYPP